jgi:hypothetical protein
VTASRVAFRETQNAVEDARGRPVGNVHLPKPERIARNGGDLQLRQNSQDYLAKFSGALNLSLQAAAGSRPI